jgi:hypothetical protein
MKGRSLSFALFFTAHAVSATAFAFVFSWISGGLTPMIALSSLALSFFRARRFVRALQNTLEWRAPEVLRGWSAAEIAILVFTLFASWKHFGWLMPYMPGANGGAITTLSPTNYGDLPLHINFIRALANGLDFLPVNPIFSLEPLRYPFGPDLYNALWEILGVPTSGHLFLAGVAATFATLVLLRETGGAWAMAAFFLAGGITQGDGPAAVDWKSLFLAVWITQRGMLWALPMGLTILLYLRPHLAGTVRLPRRAVSGLGRMWAIFPLFHAHSFFIVSLLLFTLTWRDFGLSNTKLFLRRFFIENRALAWALLPATFLISHTSAGFSKASVVHWKPWWSLTEDASFETMLTWLWRNFGLAIVALVCVASFLFLAKRLMPKDDLVQTPVRSSWDEVLILFCFFFIFMFVMLAPWEWDNIKILIWPWILVFAALGRSVLRMSRLRPSFIWPLLTWIGISTAFSPGAIVIVQSWIRPQEKSLSVWTIEQLAFGETVLMRVSKKAVFAAATTPNHVLTYFGRVRALGYQGHLWSHAIDFTKAERDLDTLMTGTEGWVEAAKALKVTHIYWGPEERLRWGSEPRAWQTRLPLVAKSGEHEVYEFKETR